MPRKKAQAAPKKKGAKSYNLPDPIPKGEILCDSGKKKWILGDSIGVGGFGEIYSAAPYSETKPKNYPFVVKIEPSDNGPLFVEKNFYLRTGKSANIEAWKKKKKLQHLGMPKLLGNGNHSCHGASYRFIVLDRYGSDLWKLFVDNGRKFSEKTVYKIAVQMIDVLEYIHSNGYIHADIKGANLLLDPKSPNNVYLVDFGLASRLRPKLKYEPDPKLAHNGTLEYTSRDAHVGVPTLRTDFEILGYNMIQWLCNGLPWMSNLNDPSAVQKQKEKAFENVEAFLTQCFGSRSRVPSPISEYMKLVNGLKFNETPNYAKFRKIFVDGLKKLGSSVDEKLEFSKSPKALTWNPTRVLDTNETLRERARKEKKSPVKSTRNPTPSPDVSSTVDDGSVTIVIKRESILGLRKILDTADRDPETEYDIRITKKRKINKIKKREKTPWPGAKKGRK